MRPGGDLAETRVALGADRPGRGLVVEAHAVTLERRRHGARTDRLVSHVAHRSALRPSGQHNSRILDGSVVFLDGFLTLDTRNHDWIPFRHRRILMEKLPQSNVRITFGSSTMPGWAV